MKKFLDNDFLLKTETAKTLFHTYGKKMPIFDYHCHIKVSEIRENKSYRNITELWLGGDHYKWRAMRLFGINEDFITGDKSDFEKFEAYATMIGFAIGNPLYHWTHLELQRYFGIQTLLCKETAKEVYDAANEVLAAGLTARKLIKMSNVTKICSTDDPIDDLKDHIALKKEGYEVEVMPTFRPDKAVLIENQEFLPYLKTLSQVAEVEINNVDTLVVALEKRINFFIAAGCKITDHAFNSFPKGIASKEKAQKVFEHKVTGKEISREDADAFQIYLMTKLAEIFSKNNLVMQLHMGALRNNNKKMFNKLGPDTGFDSIDDTNIASAVSKFLDSCDEKGILPKTVLYTLNPKDNYLLATMMGNFASNGEVATKVQFGTAWWFNDQRDGMVEQIKAFANLGVIAKFVGMLTDSRSFTSYTRHEYFRRILCDIFGDMVENGEFPQNYEVLGKIVEDISYNNIITYFDA